MHAPLLDAEIYDQIRETARRFAEDIVKPVAADLDRDETFPAEIYRRMGELGLFGITVPEEHGGAGLEQQPRLSMAREGRGGAGCSGRRKRKYRPV